MKLWWLLGILVVLFALALLVARVAPRGHQSAQADRNTAVAYTISVDQPSPAHGDTVTFTGTFPAEAFRQAHHSQFHSNPTGTVVCSDPSTGAALLYGVTYFTKSGKDPDGNFTATSSPFLLDSPSWPDGAAGACSIVTGYWTDTHSDGVQFNQVAYTHFDVSP